MLFVFAYVDIFGFWRADVMDGALVITRFSPAQASRSTSLFLCLHYDLHPDPKPHGHRLALRPSKDE